MSGAAFLGADVAELKALAVAFSRAADDLDSSSSLLHGQLSASPWAGPDREAFAARWASSDRPRLAGVAAALRAAAARLEANAAEQEQASAVDSGGGAAGGAGIHRAAQRHTGAAPIDSPQVQLNETRELKGGIRNLAVTSIFLDELYKHGGDDAGIVTITHPDGTRSHVVMIPGTQDLWNTQRDTVFNSLAWPAAGTGHEVELERRVLAMMAEHGIGADEPVQLVGHSLGGLVAANIASHRPGYNIQSVVTIASYVPTDVPDGVDTFQVIDPSDPLLSVEGAVGVVGRGVPADHVALLENNTFTYRSALGLPDAPLIPGDVWGSAAQASEGLQSHDMGRYASSLLDLQHDEGFQRWQESQSQFASRQGDVTEMSTYQIRNLPHSGGGGGGGGGGGF